MEKITFWDLIKSTSIRKICIPTIQRDYAQGRINKAYLRNSFLTALKNALDKKNYLSLDFVYGVDNATMFVPLDGQQRLTTLWLLHWYIAYKAGIVSNPEVKNILLKFSYETRISSTNFCKSLCELTPVPLGYNSDTKEKITIRTWITKQTWFFHQYMQDPTILGMLNMISGTDLTNKDGEDIIDGLEEIFKDEECDFQLLWEKLTTTQCIRFIKLQVGINDGDETYVKMNARGKQLTDFENFKTELVKYAKDETILGEVDSLEFAAKLDVQWTDIFWKYAWIDANTKDKSIDEIYFTFIRRFVSLECIKKYGDKLSISKIKKISNSFTGFEPYSEILDKVSIEKLIKIMDRLRNKTLNTQAPWGEKFEFVPKYENDKRAEITKATNTQMLLFYGYCCYLYMGEYDEKSFAEWNRVLWNICENRVDKSNFSPTISEIDLLSPHSHNIIEFLSQDSVIECANKEQLFEEQQKARQLANIPMIREMEGYAFFKGAIRFLYTDSNGNIDWTSFETKATNVKYLIAEENNKRHTIILLIPYLSNNKIKDIFYHWVSNNDEDLRFILLYMYKKATTCLHNFLMQNDIKEPFSKLHQDISDICESAYGGRGYLQTNWKSESQYVWTNYVRRGEYHGWYSYVVGNESYSRISKMLVDNSDVISIYQKQKERVIGEHIQGLYLHFKYKQRFFTLYANNTICLMTDNWRGKVPNEKNLNGDYFSIDDITGIETLIERLNNILLQVIL